MEPVDAHPRGGHRAIEPRGKCKLLGIEITPTTLSGFLSWLDEALAAQVGGVIVGHNLHSAYLYHTNPDFKEVYDSASFILTDGAPVAWDHRVSGGLSGNQRLGSTDWLPQLNLVGSLKRIAVIGASDVSNMEFRSWLEKRFPAVRVEGVSGEAWDEAKVARAENLLVRYNPQLVLIGLGMPLQESFIAAARANNKEIVFAAIGGAIDQLGGNQRNAPRWLGPLGLEWLWRLLSQPRRLGQRYLVEPWKLLWVRLKSVKGRTAK